MKKLILSIVCCWIFANTSLHAQKYFTRDGQVSFSSESPMEKIEADNDKLTCVLDMETGDIQFAALIQSFHFDKALMQEHFNENYMESGKFPKATFKGAFLDWDSVDKSSSEEQKVSVSGVLTIHGESQEIMIEGIFMRTDDTLRANSTFEIKLADYGVSIPGVVRDNISEVVQIKVDMHLTELVK